MSEINKENNRSTIIKIIGVVCIQHVIQQFYDNNVA